MTEQHRMISKTVEYVDPMLTAQLGMTMSGLDFISGMANGTVPPPPIAALMNMDVETVQPGRVVFGGTTDGSHYNGNGVVHGGFACTMLDTVIGCAVTSALPAGQACTSIELKVSFLKPLQGGRRLLATGTVAKLGRRVAFAEATLATEDGTWVATASSSLMIFEPAVR